jgi:hypothetical protein
LARPVFAQVTFSDKTDFITGNYPISLSVADLNGDGKPDLVTVGGTSLNKVSVLMNTTTPGAAAPTFSTKTDFSTGYAPWSVSIGDLNGDGKPDLAVVNNFDSTFSILLNSTAPGVTTPSFLAKTDFNLGKKPSQISVGDLNNDGKPDLVIANNQNDLISVLINTTAPGAATPTFATNKAFEVDSVPSTVIIDDLNGDGKPDIATSNISSHNISVLMNMTMPGDTTPAFAAKTDIETGSYPDCIASGDLNGDGKPDLATTGQGPVAVSILLNTTTPGSATPTFSTHTEFATGTTPYYVSIKDLNGDGKPDLAVANYLSDSVSVLLNTTSPGASVPTFMNKIDFATGNSARCVSVDDFNGDYKQDLAVANSDDNTVSVLLNTTTLGVATPSFSARTNFTTGTQPFSVSSGDLNGDGMPDLAVANSASNSVSVLLSTTSPGAATPSFSTKTDFTTGTTPRSVSINDFNGDGMLDLATANNGANSISIFLNTTAPGATAPVFSAKTDFSTSSLPSSVCMGDFNGDGKPDLATANAGNGTVSILLNTTAPGAATPTFSAKTDSTAGTSSVSISTADLNGDGKLDLAVANQSASTVSVLLNATAPGAATPTFRYRTNFTVGSSPRSVSIGDLNGDGKPDLVTANYTDGTVSILLNTTTAGATTPTFSAKTDSTTRTIPISVSIGDLNGDGKPDLAVAANATASVLLNLTAPGAATPVFSAHKDFTAGSSTRCILIDDLNGDGKADLAVANMVNDNVSVLLNNADLPVGVEMQDELAPVTFGLAQNYPNPFNPSTRISFTLTNTEYAKLVVYNLLGQQVKTLFDGMAEKQREYTFDFDALHLASGVYFYKIQTPTRTEVRKMMLMK